AFAAVGLRILPATVQPPLGRATTRSTDTTASTLKERRGKARDGKRAFAGRAGERRPAWSTLLFDHNRCDHGRLQQDRNRGGGCRPGKRARSEAREKLRDAAGEVERALAARRARLFGVDRGEQLLHRARRGRTQRLV